VTRRAPAGAFPVTTGVAQLVEDPDRPRAFTLLLDGSEQSYVDLDDPTHLEFEYVRWMARLLDLVTGPTQRLDVLHLGGGALTLPRYLTATRPSSRHTVVEVDPELVALVRRRLPLPEPGAIRIRIGDGRRALAAESSGRWDVLLMDAFAGARVPRHLRTLGVVRDAARVLRPGGLYLVNVTDGPPLAFARSQAAAVRAVFRHTCLVSETGVLHGRRHGNVVVAGSGLPLPVTRLVRAVAGDPVPAKVVFGDGMDRFVSGAPLPADEEDPDDAGQRSVTSEQTVTAVDGRTAVVVRMTDGDDDRAFPRPM
jgi:SAM-dependent methyltransferase